jgi:hypothetical protein
LPASGKPKRLPSHTGPQRLADDCNYLVLMVPSHPDPLGDLMDRAAIGSLADLRRMYETELAANRRRDRSGGRGGRRQVRGVRARITGNILRRVLCDGPMPDAKWQSRLYCSGNAHTDRRFAV